MCFWYGLKHVFRETENPASKCNGWPDIVAEIDLNGMDSNVGDDSDSIGNAPRTVRSGGSAGGAGLTMPTKEKRKPFFKKVWNSLWLVAG